MFETISYLLAGNDIQCRAHKAISDLNIMNDLADAHPVLCGTIPLAIDVKGSDLDIVMEIYDFERFKRTVKMLYVSLEGFVLEESLVRAVPTMTCNFRFGGFEFELFGQPQPVERQHAYRHMLIEHHLLETNPHVRAEIIRLKEKGIKTEPAFAQVFGLVGDPYDELLALGDKLGV